MPIQVSPLNALTISAAEVARVETELSAQSSMISSQVAVIADLRAQLAAAPPVVVPPQPVTGRTRLYVDGRKMKTKKGQPFVMRSIEFMYTNDCHSLGPAKLCDLLIELGANACGPLFADSHGDLAKVRAFCDAARARGLVVFVNGDHQRTEGGRNWFAQPGMVSLLNGYDHVGIQCEVETDDAESGAAWVLGANSLVRALRTAGHKSIIKVGAPQGGRLIEYPLAHAPEVLAADPEKQVVFSAQMYWPQATSNTWYQSEAGVAPGLAGTLQALDKLAAAPVCFMPGFDWEDNVGLTGELVLIDRADALGLSWQHWVLTGDGTLAGNNMIDRFDWTMSIGSITPNGKLLQAKLLARRAFAAL